MKKFSAKLLFQYRVDVPGEEPRAFRMCEERMVTFQSRNVKHALSRAKKIAQATTYDFENANGDRVFFEFVGVVDLLHLGAECQPGEVWYDIVDRLRPMERRAKLIRSDSELLERGG